jgi:GTPase
MRALTGSEVLVEDKLFATLDTPVRALQAEAKPRVLSENYDTTGRIMRLRGLPGAIARLRRTIAVS